MPTEPSFRGQGLGLEATKLMMGYGNRHIYQHTVDTAHVLYVLEYISVMSTLSIKIYNFWRRNTLIILVMLCNYYYFYLACLGITELGVQKFQAKINTDNQPSLKLFQEKLAFVKVCACMNWLHAI